MKKVALQSLKIIVAVSLILGSMSCKKKKAIIPPPQGEVEVSVPCSEFKSDDQYFRVSAVGESMDMVTAKKKAMSNAKAELAGMISSTLKVVGDNYVKSSEYNNQEEVLERFEEMARVVVNQKLNGIVPVCDRVTQVQSTKNYKYYLALELSGNELANDYYNSLTKEESLKIDYNYERFKKTFDEEMKKLEQ